MSIILTVLFWCLIGLIVAVALGAAFGLCMGTASLIMDKIEEHDRRKRWQRAISD